MRNYEDLFDQGSYVRTISSPVDTLFEVLVNAKTSEGKLEIINKALPRQKQSEWEIFLQFCEKRGLRQCSTRWDAMNWADVSDEEMELGQSSSNISLPGPSQAGIHEQGSPFS
jgi:hypothetical protein